MPAKHPDADTEPGPGGIVSRHPFGHASQALSHGNLFITAWQMQVALTWVPLIDERTSLGLAAAISIDASAYPERLKSEGLKERHAW